MAVSLVHRLIIRELSRHGILPRGGALLEIGEANWYAGDDPREMVRDIEEFVVDPVLRDALIKRTMDGFANPTVSALFDLVKVHYEIYFAPCETQAIDFHGTAAAHKLDLNGPIQLNHRFEVVINHGTAEHIFNIAQVFRTIHEHTVPGGLMIHESPFTGWVDHGFYTLQPTLFFDVAEANAYPIYCMVIEDLATNQIREIRSRDSVHEFRKSKLIPENAQLFTVMSKGAAESEFRVPQQGYYRQSLSPQAMEAWNSHV